jgi:hypothetical protein
VANDVSQLVNNPSAKFAKAFQFNKTIDSGLSQIITTFNKDSLKLQVSNIEGSWGIANQKNDAIVNEYLSLLGNLKEITANPLFAASVNFSPNTSALEAFITRKFGSENLSDRVWKIGDQLRNEMEIHLGVGIMNGDSSEVISRRIRQYLQKPDDLFRRVKNEAGHLIPSNAMTENAPGKGVYNSAYKNAMRLARTETNMAFQLADHERWMNMQMVTGQRIELSGSHPDYNYPEICEELEGDYPKEFIFAGWHVQCLCHVVPIMMPKDDFRSFLRGETKTIEPKQLKDYPSNFEAYLKANAEKFTSEKNTPYWFSNNAEIIRAVVK